jgi:hypothetical protein
VKDLGVYLDVSLNFKQHFNVTTSKANLVLGLIRRFEREFDDVYVVKSLFCSLVLPILEYGNVVWMPFFDNARNRMEGIKKQFLLFCLRSLG